MRPKCQSIIIIIINNITTLTTSPLPCHPHVHGRRAKFEESNRCKCLLSYTSSATCNREEWSGHGFLRKVSEIEWSNILMSTKKEHDSTIPRGLLTRPPSPPVLLPSQGVWIRSVTLCLLLFVSASRDIVLHQAELLNISVLHKVERQ